MGTKIIHVEVIGQGRRALQNFYSNVFGWSLDTNNPGGYGMLPPGRPDRRHRRGPGRRRRAT